MRPRVYRTEAVRALVWRFQPGGRNDLPLTTQDAIDMLTSFTIGGPRWPDSGLSIAENRELFSRPLDGPGDLERVTTPVATGLKRRFDRG